MFCLTTKKLPVLLVSMVVVTVLACTEVLVSLFSNFADKNVLDSVRIETFASNAITRVNTNRSTRRVITPVNTNTSLVSAPASSATTTATTLASTKTQQHQQPQQLNMSLAGSCGNSTFTVSVSPLRPLDFQQFTVRIPSWKRENELNAVIHHLLGCETVAQIQVVWCIAQGPIPQWLSNHSAFPRVVVEEHEDDSLNARFHIIKEPPTAAILNQDDDVIRPCIALEAGFAIWTQNPERMVGYDPRIHKINEQGQWLYSTRIFEKTPNGPYSMALTKFAFTHKDYLQSYTHQMPAIIRDHVKQHKNCEDIAMTFWISSVLQGNMPLVADYWAMKSEVKMGEDHGISTMSNHTNIRHGCMDLFAKILCLKEGPTRLRSAQLLKKKALLKNFQSGDLGRALTNHSNVPPVVLALLRRRERWNRMEFVRMRDEINRIRLNTTQHCQNYEENRVGLKKKKWDLKLSCIPHNFSS